MTRPAPKPAIYVVSFEPDRIKVGYSTQARKRVEVHDLAARRMGSRVVAKWISEPHRNAKSNERALIDFCAKQAQPATWGSRGEYFVGIDFDSVCAFAASLPKRRLAPLAKDPHATCPACMRVHKRPLTALSLLDQVATGQLRIIDSAGRDVSHGWAGSLVAHNCGISKVDATRESAR